MSSLHIKNRCTPSHFGNGLPIYDKLEYVFANWNAGFNGIDGLMVVPTNKVPTIQFENDVNTYVSFKFLPSTGGVPIVGGTPYVFAANPWIITPVIKNGVQIYIWSLHGDGTLITPAPVGRWIAELICSDPRKFYTEEFTTTDCF